MWSDIHMRTTELEPSNLLLRVKISSRVLHRPVFGQSHRIQRWRLVMFVGRLDFTEWHPVHSSISQASLLPPHLQLPQYMASGWVEGRLAFWRLFSKPSRFLLPHLPHNTRWTWEHLETISGQSFICWRQFIFYINFIISKLSSSPHHWGVCYFPLTIQLWDGK